MASCDWNNSFIPETTVSPETNYWRSIIWRVYSYDTTPSDYVVKYPCHITRDTLLSEEWLQHTCGLFQWIVLVPTRMTLTNISTIFGWFHGPMTLKDQVWHIYHKICAICPFESKLQCVQCCFLLLMNMNAIHKTHPADSSRTLWKYYTRLIFPFWLITCLLYKATSSYWISIEFFALSRQKSYDTLHFYVYPLFYGSNHLCCINSGQFMSICNLLFRISVISIYLIAP